MKNSWYGVEYKTIWLGNMKIKVTSIITSYSAVKQCKMSFYFHAAPRKLNGSMYRCCSMFRKENYYFCGFTYFYWEAKSLFCSLATYNLPDNYQYEIENDQKQIQTWTNDFCKTTKCLLPIKIIVVYLSRWRRRWNLTTNRNISQPTPKTNTTYYADHSFNYPLSEI